MRALSATQKLILEKASSDWQVFLTTKLVNMRSYQALESIGIIEIELSEHVIPSEKVGWAFRLSSNSNSALKANYDATKHPSMTWREVVHVESNAGKKGGNAWWLTLECGHHKSVPIPNYNRLCKPLNKYEAPKKCICLLCRLDATGTMIKT